jgi:beta-galactosidase
MSIISGGRRVAFNKAFVWGAATSSYQVEGGVREDGKGQNIWDVFTKERGRIYNSQNGDTACDHFHKFREDIALMKEIGIRAYRFSIDWSRVIPDGAGEVSEKGLAFYDRLVDELLANGIEPYVTLYHWELPYELYKRGGWMNPQIVEWFGRYAAVISERLSGRVTNYFTINEPQCFIGLGFLTGEHAPGLISPLRDTFEMAHNVLKAHGRAVQMLRANSRQALQIGFAPTCGMCYPASDSPEDVEAARRAMFSLNPDDGNWTWNIPWWSDPVLLGRYPEEGLARYEAYLPKITDEDMKLISEPVDIYGQNIYNGRCIRMGADGRPEEVRRYEGFPRTASDWPVTPEALYWGPKFLYERYHRPLYITENGASCHDLLSVDGKVHDPNRVEFMRQYLHELSLVSDEIDLRGYFYWSLMDNFEWSKGYSERFGLVYVDYQTQQRTLKDSAYWYGDIIRENGKQLL